MKTIWKYTLEVTDFQNIEIPIDYEILSLQVQYDKPCLWLLVNPESPKEKRSVRIFGTGHNVPEEIDSSYWFVGTFQILYGNFVGHVFLEE